MTQKKDTTEPEKKNKMPSPEEVAREPGKAKSIDDLYGNVGDVSPLFVPLLMLVQPAEIE